MREPDSEAAEESGEPEEPRRAFGWRARAQLDSTDRAASTRTAAAPEAGEALSAASAEQAPGEDAAITWRESRRRAPLLIGGVVLTLSCHTCW